MVRYWEHEVVAFAMQRKFTCTILLLLFLLSLVSCEGAQRREGSGPAPTDTGAGGKITLAWDSNTEAFLGGYRVSYGPASRSYEKVVDIGKPAEASPGVTKYTLTGLIKGQKYYIAVQAYPAGGKAVMSGFSNEISSVAK